MKDNLAIELTGVSKRYRTSKHEDGFYALRDVDLRIGKGGRVGIMGDNGAGKTTLLKIIAGVTKPSKGKVEVDGKVVSLISLEAGFELDLTGRENIMMNGLLIGMRKEKIKLAMDEIIDFADIGEFIDLPFFTYSSGMKFRLAFAIAIANKSDILVIDEIFQSGDYDYKIKTMRRMKKMQRQYPELTTIVCSHLSLYLWGFADQFYELSKGTVREKGEDEMRKKMRGDERKMMEIVRG